MTANDDSEKLLRSAAAARSTATPRRRALQFETPEMGKEAAIFHADVLFVVRESAEYEWMLLRKMLEQTLRPYENFPEVALLLAEGPGLLLNNADGDRARGALSGERLDVRPGGKIYAARANVGRFHLLIGLTSAGKATGSGGVDNLWAQQLARAVREVRPQKLVSGPFSRMVRNQDFAGPVHRELRTTGTLICPAEHREGFTVNDQAGNMFWTMLVAMSNSDWIATLTRLQTGLIFELRAGRYPRSGRMLPPGYRRIDDGVRRGHVVPVPEEADAVKALIRLAASDRSLAEIAVELDALGLRGRRPGSAPTLTSLDGPEAAVQRLFAHLPTYLDGNYLQRQANTIPGIVEFHGETVHRHAPDDPGYFEFILNFGVPEGGWAPRAEIEAAIARRFRSQPRNATTTASSDRAALVGLGRWSDSTHEYRLRSDEATYELRRRPIPVGSGGAMRQGRWKSAGETELVGRFRVTDLHHLVAEVIRNVLDQPQPTVLPGPHDPGLAHVSEWSEQASALTRKAATSRDLAINANSADERNRYAEKAKQFESEAVKLRSAVAAQQSSHDLAAASSMSADTHRLAVTAQLIDSSRGPVTSAVNLAAAQAIADLRFDAVAGVPTARVHIKVRVATTAGQLVLGPFIRDIRNTSRGAARPDHVSERDLAVANELLRASATERKALMVREGANERGIRRRVTRVLRTLIPTKSAVAVLLDHPVEQVRLAIIDDECQLPADFATELRAIYLDPDFNWTTNWCRGDPSDFRRALAWIARYHPSDDGVAVDELREVTGLKEVHLYAMLNTDPSRYLRERPSTAPLLESTIPWRPHAKMDSDARRVRLPRCPHCDKRTLSQVLFIPELPDGRLCTQCLRAPSVAWQFPDEYLLPWVGARQGNRTIRSKGQSRQIPIGTHQQPYKIPPRRPAKL